LNVSTALFLQDSLALAVVAGAAALTTGIGYLALRLLWSGIEHKLHPRG
jgi:hypothetical protein